MDVTDAVMARKSIRAFLGTPIDDQVIADLLTKAARAPSARCGFVPKVTTLSAIATGVAPASRQAAKPLNLHRNLMP